MHFLYTHVMYLYDKTIKIKNYIRHHHLKNVFVLPLTLQIRKCIVLLKEKVIKVNIINKCSSEQTRTCVRTLTQNLLLLISNAFFITVLQFNCI